MVYETEKIEFKSRAVGDIYKDVVAFVNTDGGTLYLGISDDGKITPLSDVDDTYTRITNGIRDSISPDATVFIKYTLEDDDTIRIDINEGSYKPYYLKSKGLKPSGVYIRHGASSVQASTEQIRQMIKESDGDVFIEMPSLEQELTFDSCSEIFKKRSVEFSQDKFNTLSIWNHRRQQYTNLGLLLSDQCAHSIKIAVYSDEQNTVFRARKEFTGSVLKQLDEAFAYLELCNRNSSVIEGLVRKDYWDYPEDAIRECLMNAILHRDYGFSGSIIVNVNDSCMEFISIGGLLPGITTADIRNGISQARNQKLMRVFEKLDFIDGYGRGIRSILEAYENCQVPVTINVTPNSFKITLPNMNASKAKTTSQNVVISETIATYSYQPKLTPQMEELIAYLREHGEISNDEVQAILNIKRTRSFVLLKQMSELGIVSIKGRGDDRTISLNPDYY